MTLSINRSQTPEPIYSAEQKFTAVKFAIVPDYDRDGIISEKEYMDSTGNRIFHFWINDDNDIDANSGSNELAPLNNNHSDDKVNGLRDLNDWFPVTIDIRGIVGAFNMLNCSYWLCHENGAVNILLRADGKPFTFTSSTQFNNTHLFDPETANYLLEGKVTDVSKEGVELSEQLLVSAEGRVTILLEGKKTTQALIQKLVLEARPKLGDPIKYRFPLALSSVTEMYRQLNLRSLCGGTGGMPTRLTQPPNMPDAETNDKDIVYLHGYNINGPAAIAEQSTAFKNLWWCGSNARFHGVSWYGDDTQIPDKGVTVNFYINSTYAFTTAPQVSNYIKGLSGEGRGSITVIAHSLGNMVASAAISLHKAPAANYFMLDAAVAQEAYLPLDTARRNAGMVNANWDGFTTTGYPNKLFASEWHTLFSATDRRSRLTMRGIFTDWGETRVINFYSSGEDVLDNGPKEIANDWTSLNFSNPRLYVWCSQEKLKGRIPEKMNLCEHPSWWGAWYLGSFVNPLLLPPTQTSMTQYANEWLTAFVNETYPNKEGGWMINERNLMNNYSVPRDWTGGILYRKKTLTEMLDPMITADAVPSYFPLFTLPAELTDVDATEANAYALQHRESLLSHVFPATTYAAGRNPFLDGETDFEDWNMNDLVECMKHGWYQTGEPKDWTWTHSDFRDVCILYTQEFFKKMTEKGNLK
jgi:pimeloyl-ACP methyl ester carboxylesterase